MVASRFLTFAACIQQVLAACSSIEVRKEWRAFTIDEQTAWIDAVKCMAALPHSDSLVATVGQFASIANISSDSSYYDDYVYVHADLNPVIHDTGLFFPWHRYFVWAYTQSLKTDCGYTGVSPYWDWTLDSADVEHASLWSDDSLSGLGQADGVAGNDFEVGTGGFATNFTLAYPSVHGLRRNFTIKTYVDDAGDSRFPDPYIDANATFTPEIITGMIANYTGDFKGFQKYMEGWEGPHGSVHEIMGGDLSGHCPKNASAACFAAAPSPTYSANEPLFWLHHAMVDRIWWLWQNAHPNNTYAFEGGSVQNLTYWDEFPNGSPPWLDLDSVMPTDGILLPEQTTLGDVWITEGDLLCYTYDDA